jgi:hypothetical protein
MKDQTIIIITTARDLADVIEKVIADRQATKPEPKFSERMSRAEAARFAGVSYITFSKWVNRGLIRESGFGKKKFVFRQEVIEALKKQS